jgi:hypothetical protein
MIDKILHSSKNTIPFLNWFLSETWVLGKRIYWKDIKLANCQLSNLLRLDVSLLLKLYRYGVVKRL